MNHFTIGNDNLKLVENAKFEWRLTSQNTTDQVVTFTTKHAALRYLKQIQTLAHHAKLHIYEI
ncbi:MAG: hypothetical protein ACHQQQ_07105 [Bacteroidota bacterium]